MPALSFKGNVREAITWEPYFKQQLSWIMRSLWCNIGLLWEIHKAVLMLVFFQKSRLFTLAKVTVIDTGGSEQDQESLFWWEDKYHHNFWCPHTCGRDLWEFRELVCPSRPIQEPTQPGFLQMYNLPLQSSWQDSEFIKLRRSKFIGGRKWYPWGWGIPGHSLDSGEPWGLC